MNGKKDYIGRWVSKSKKIILEEIKHRFVEHIIIEICKVLYLHPILLVFLPIVILIVFIIAWYLIMIN